MQLVELVSQADIGAQHHLFVASIAGKLIYADPHVFVRVSTDILFWAPSVSEQRFVVTIIELALIFWCTPVSIVSGVFQVSLTKSVSTTDRSSQSPSMPFVSVPTILLLPPDVINEDRFESFTSIFRIWHETDIFWAFMNGLPTNI